MNTRTSYGNQRSSSETGFDHGKQFRASACPSKIKLPFLCTDWLNFPDRKRLQHDIGFSIRQVHNGCAHGQRNSQRITASSAPVTPRPREGKACTRIILMSAKQNPGRIPQ